jgi:hypothetical protein
MNEIEKQTIEKVLDLINNSEVKSRDNGDYLYVCGYNSALKSVETLIQLEFECEIIKEPIKKTNSNFTWFMIWRYTAPFFWIEILAFWIGSIWFLLKDDYQEQKNKF